MDGSVLMWVVVVVVLAIVVAGCGYIFYKVFGNGEPLPPVEHDDVIASNRKAIDEGRLNDLRFELAPRGYRQDQGDAALAQIEAGRPSRVLETTGDESRLTTGDLPQESSQQSTSSPVSTALSDGSSPA